MNDTRWKILFQLSDLNDTILEGTLYLMNAKDNYEKIVRNDVLEAIEVLKASLSDQNLLTLEAEKKMDELHRNINTSGTRMEPEEMLAKISNQVFEAVDTALIHRLLSVIKEYSFVDKNTAEEFLTFLHKHHVQNPDLDNLILKLLFFQ